MTAPSTILSVPKMGSVGSTFGRNLKPNFAPDLFDTPNPVTVAQQLLHRDTFHPARSLNILAAAWIQFQVHDWVNHARHPLGKDDIVVPLPDGMKWTSKVGGERRERHAHRRQRGARATPAAIARRSSSAMPPRIGGTGRRSTVPTARRR